MSLAKRAAIIIKHHMESSFDLPQAQQVCLTSVGEHVELLFTWKVGKPTTQWHEGFVVTCSRRYSNNLLLQRNHIHRGCTLCSTDQEM